MDHAIRIIRTDHEDPSVPAAFHATCSCGWATEGHDQAQVEAAVAAHERGDHEIPVPASPSPITPTPEPAPE